MIDDLIGIFSRDLDRLYHEIESCNEEILWTTKGSIKNPAGNLCLHLVGNLNTYIGKNLGRTDYVRNRDQEFSLRNLPKQSLLQKVESTKNVVVKSLQSLDETDLEKIYPENVFGYEMTTRFFLIHLTAHLSYHLGQINYLRRMLD